ncbi:hypothetical protein F8E02_06435 [Methanoculleus sp. Wushi-C6]|uniref:Uncharacterized protein n=1 Tax=Methanoculleus caldifontis TaxID=2651577 RepID=A0ABU3X0R6_9EURY|nr:hypothetical protein [Methanoculleus sp. Wushi-C6]
MQTVSAQLVARRERPHRIDTSYTSRGTPHSGLLERCPAIGHYDATVTEGAPHRAGERYRTDRRLHCESNNR